MKKILAGFAVAAFAVSAAGASAASYNFTRDLTIGSTGADVVALQDILISGNYLVMPAGVSKGYFGSITASAVAKWQAAAKLPSTGYFGPMSRAAIAGSVVVDNGGNTGGNTSGDLKGGDGDFRDYDVLGNPSNEDVDEDETIEVLGFEFEAYRSDLRIERVDVLFAEDGAKEDKPWKVLEEVLIVDEDGEEIASVDASDEESWEEESTDDTYSIRFDDVDYVVEEGDEVKLFIAVTATDDLDDTDDQGTWDVSILDDGIRAINAEGIDTYEGDETDTKEFTLGVATPGSLDITVHDDDNEDEEVEVDEEDETEEVVLYTALAEAEDGDVLIEEITVDLATTTATVGSDASGLDSIIKTLYLYVDGDEVGSESVDSANTDSVTFDDLDIEVGEDEEIEITVVADINESEDNFANGDGVVVTDLDIDYVDDKDDDYNEAAGVQGGDITFSTEALMIELSGNPSASAVGTVGTFKIAVKVTAPDDEDIYVPEYAATTTAKGAKFTIVDGQGTTIVDGAGVGTTTVASISASGATKNNGHYRITKGNTATLTVNVQISNANGAGNIARKIELDSVNYRVGADNASLQQYTAGIDSDFETDVVTISNEN